MEEENGLGETFALFQSPKSTAVSRPKGHAYYRQTLGLTSGI